MGDSKDLRAPADEASANADSPAAVDPAASGIERTPRWRNWTAALVAGLGVLGAIAGIVSLIDSLTRSTSGFDSVDLTASVIGDGTQAWAVSVDALASFPSSDSTCDAVQSGWLEANGSPVERRVVVSMVNNAREGAQVSLSSFVAIADSQAGPDRPAVLVVCDPVPGATFPVQFAMLDVDRGAAVYVRPVREGERADAEIPIVWNLAPGEAGTLTLNIYSKQAIEGSLAVAVTSGGQTRQLAIDGSEFVMPALLQGGAVVLYAEAEGLRCEQLLLQTVMPCTLDGVRAAVENEAPRATAASVGAFALNAARR